MHSNRYARLQMIQVENVKPRQPRLETSLVLSLPTGIIVSRSLALLLFDRITPRNNINAPLLSVSMILWRLILIEESRGERERARVEFIRPGLIYVVCRRGETKANFFCHGYCRIGGSRRIEWLERVIKSKSVSDNLKFGMIVYLFIVDFFHYNFLRKYCSTNV